MINGAGDGILGFEQVVSRFDAEFEPWLGSFMEDLEEDELAVSPQGRLAAVERSLVALIDRLDDEGVYKRNA